MHVNVNRIVLTDGLNFPLFLLHSLLEMCCHLAEAAQAFCFTVVLRSVLTGTDFHVAWLSAWLDYVRRSIMYALRSACASLRGFRW